MNKNKFLLKLSQFIVNCRYLFLCLFIIIIILCIRNLNNFRVNYDVFSYLPEETETKQGLKLVKREFGEINEIYILIQDISYEEVLKRIDSINDIENVKNIFFENTEQFYKDNNALIVVNLGEVSSMEKNNIKDSIVKIIKNDKYYLYIENGKTVHNDNYLIFLIIVCVIGLMLLIVSHSYFDLILAGFVFSVSILLNVGSNFLFGEIFYVTNDIYIFLQLIFSFYIFIIFLNHYYKEIDDISNKKLAVMKSIAKSFPIIFINSLIIISCLMVLIFMKLQIGIDLAVFLSKGIICSMLTVLLLLPCLLMIFNKIILKLRHRYFVPCINKFGIFIVSARKIILPMFLLLLFISVILISKLNYTYDIYSIDSQRLVNKSVAVNKIQDIFGIRNQLNVIVRDGDKDYQKELKIAQKLLHDKKILSVTNIGSIKISDNLYLGSPIGYQEFSDFFNIDIELSKKIFEMYAFDNNETIKLNDLDNYHISVINIIDFLYEKKDDLLIENQLKDQIDNYYLKSNNFRSLYESNDYSRFIVEYKGDKESNDTFKLLDMIREDIENEYSEAILVGESISVRNIKSIFNRDIVKVFMITLLFLLILFLFIFRLSVMAIILVFIVEGSVFINFGIGTLIYNRMFFLSYIIVCAVQISFSINYVMSLANRYMILRSRMGKLSAIQVVFKDNYLDIIICGLMLMVSGFLMGYIADSGVVASIGIFLGIGSIISILMIILVFPCALYIFDRIINIKKIGKK